MAPNNFYKNIQQKFNSRKIEPSAQAWDRLDAMLTVAEEKNQPKNYFWLKIAASFLLFVAIGFVFFQQNQLSEIAQPKQEVVTTQETPINKIDNNFVTKKETKTTSKKTVAFFKKTNNVVNSSENFNEKLEIPFEEAISEKTNKINFTSENKIKNEEQINEGLHKKTTYNYISPETLLAQVQGEKQVNKNSNTYKSIVKVNPNELLYSVETELDQSFKNKAFTKIKQAKLALVNRNYQ